MAYVNQSVCGWYIFFTCNDNISHKETIVHSLIVWKVSTTGNKHPGNLTSLKMQKIINKTKRTNKQKLGIETNIFWKLSIKNLENLNYLRVRKKKAQSNVLSYKYKLYWKHCKTLHCYM